MATERCPSCGAPYNGRKCRRCLYQSAPGIRPAPSRPRNTSRPKSPRKARERSALGSLLGFLVLLALIALLLPLLRNWGQDLKAVSESQAVSQFSADQSAIP